MVLVNSPWGEIVAAKENAENLTADRASADGLQKLHDSMLAAAAAIRDTRPELLKRLNNEITRYPVGDRRAVVRGMGMSETALVACEMLAAAAARPEPKLRGGSKPRGESYYAVAREVASLFWRVTSEPPTLGFQSGDGRNGKRELIGGTTFCRALHAVCMTLGMAKNGALRGAAQEAIRVFSAAQKMRH